MIRDLFDAPEAYVPPERAESIQMLQERVQKFLDMLSDLSKQNKKFTRYLLHPMVLPSGDHELHRSL